MQTGELGKQIPGEELAGLTPEERDWLAAYRRQLEEEFPGIVEQIVIFGSKARGDATEESDLDVLLVITAGDWKLREAVARPGYLLAVGTEVVPCLMVYTAREWARRRQESAPFWQTVTRDGVSVR